MMIILAGGENSPGKNVIPCSCACIKGDGMRTIVESGWSELVKFHMCFNEEYSREVIHQES